MLHSGVDTLLFKLIKLNRNLLYPQAYVSLGNAQLGCKLQFEIMGRVEGSGIYITGCHSAMPPPPRGRRMYFFVIIIIIIIIIIYLLKQEDAHMINTRTRAGQERHRKLALTLCP